MVKAVGWLTCMGCSLRGSKFKFSFKCRCVKKCRKYIKNIASNNGKPQITMAASEVNSKPQKLIVGALELPPARETKPHGNALLTRTEEEPEFYI